MIIPPLLVEASLNCIGISKINNSYEHQFESAIFRILPKNAMIPFLFFYYTKFNDQGATEHSWLQNHMDKNKKYIHRITVIFWVPKYSNSLAFNRIIVFTKYWDVAIKNPP